jgi:hypothetical protein
MSRDESNSTEPHLTPPADSAAAPSPDDQFAAQLRGFGPIGLLAILITLSIGNVFIGPMVSLPIGATLVLVWRWLSRTPWSEIGFVRPKSWVVTVAGGIVFGIALKFLMKALVMPLLGADPVNEAFHFLTGNRAILPAAIFTMIVSAGFGEETVFRGYAFERFGKVFGNTVWAKMFIVLFTSLWFGLEHYSFQRLPGTEQAVIVGIVFGAIFAKTGRIFPLMIAHAAFDLTALAMIYWNLETSVAHLIFK